MSQHKSLKISKYGKSRTVRKKRERFETIYLKLLEQGGLDKDQIKIYGLPKEKIFKLKKEKKDKKEETSLTPIT